ncbi:MAG: Protein of unknown function transrane [Firmicutes bacterium]|nr:Protein of unknown function transrane [Bacillota bacterium]
MFQTFADYMTYEVFKIEPGTQLAGAVDFFIYDSLKIFFMLTVIIFLWKRVCR